MRLSHRVLSIQTRLIAGIGLAATALVMLVGWYWTAREERELNAALELREARMAQLLARGFAGPVWNLDNAAIANLLDAVMADPEVHAITLSAMGVEGLVLSRSRKEAAVQPLAHRFEVIYQARAGSASSVVGHVDLVYTRALVRASVASTRRFVASLLAAVLLAVVGASYVLVNRLVKRPVSRLGDLASRVAEGELGAQLPVERADEVGVLTAQLNAMSLQLQQSSLGLRASEERYRSLFENASEGIFQADSHGRLLGLNRALASMLGYARPEQARLQGASLRRLARVQPDEYRRIARALLRHRLLQQVPMLVATRDGRELWIELSVHLVADAQGRQRIEGMVSDISQRRLAEQELTRHRDHLEDLVAERTQELSQAKQRAESANQSKSRFLATMSHEFRTPLNAILGFAQLLQMDASLQPAQQGKIKLIRDSGEHLLSLITDLLDMASIEAGKVSLQTATLDLLALVEMVCDAVRLRSHEKGLEFRLELHPGVPTRVRADGQRLRQVLLNLLSNAVKFTDHGHVSLRLDLLAFQGGMARVRFEVSDTGIGIPAEQLARLFQPFEQVSEATRRQGGTGLGLSISQELVRLMGGEIEVRTELGRGSSFQFVLELPVQAMAALP
ncbi:ATP-binding protein [Paucibacter soli]|uniref:ATP-binding protein n=1 Tax=Paucibacter soli TaxID=3133433 RepID=UPI0030B76CAA